MCQHRPIPPLVSGNLATLETSKPLVLFSLIMTSYFPHRWKDLTAYKLLIFRTYRQFSGRVWLGYDQAFCQYVAAVELVKQVSNEWSSIQFSCQWAPLLDRLNRCHNESASISNNLQIMEQRTLFSRVIFLPLHPLLQLMCRFTLLQRLLLMSRDSG